MGEKKIPYEPKYEPVRDDVIGKRFAQSMVRPCPHPKVKERYGIGGVANVSVYTCKKCRFVKTYEYHGGVGCGYGLEQDIQAGAENSVG